MGLDPLTPPTYVEELNELKMRLFSLEQPKHSLDDYSLVEICGSQAHQGNVTDIISLESTPWYPKGDVSLVSVKTEIAIASAADFSFDAITSSGQTVTTTVRSGELHGIKRASEAIGMNPSTSLIFKADFIPADWGTLTIHAYFRTNNPSYVSGGVNFPLSLGGSPVDDSYLGALQAGYLNIQGQGITNEIQAPGVLVNDPDSSVVSSYTQPDDTRWGVTVDPDGKVTFIWLGGFGNNAGFDFTYTTQFGTGNVHVQYTGE